MVLCHFLQTHTTNQVQAEDRKVHKGGWEVEKDQVKVDKEEDKEEDEEEVEEEEAEILDVSIYHINIFSSTFFCL